MFSTFMVLLLIFPFGEKILNLILSSDSNFSVSYLGFYTVIFTLLIVILLNFFFIKSGYEDISVFETL